MPNGIGDSPEMQKTITISWGLLIGIVTFSIAMTFVITSFYLQTSTIENRMDKRHTRITNELIELNNRVIKLEHSEKQK